MFKRITAMLLTGALCVTLVIAADPDALLPGLLTDTAQDTDAAQQAKPEEDAGAQDADGQDADTQDADTQDADAQATAVDGVVETTPEEKKKQADAEEAAAKQGPPPAGTYTLPQEETAAPTVRTPRDYTVAWSGIDARVREANLTVQYNNQMLQTISKLDIGAMQRSLEKQISSLSSLGKVPGMEISAQSQMSQLAAQIDELDNQAITLERAREQTGRQYAMTADNLVMGAQTIFLSLHSLDVQQADLQRNLNAMDRSLGEMQRRYELGQIAEIDLIKLKNQRASLAASIETIKVTVKGLRGDLALLLGCQPNDSLTLTALPEPSHPDYNYNEDLQSAIKNSYELYFKNESLQQSIRDGKNYTVEADKIAYESTERQLVQNFTKLYDAIDEKERQYKLAQETEATKKRELAVAGTKYERGLISKNEYLTAQDDYAAAQSATQSAKNHVFTAINQYDWAVKGVVSAGA